MQLGDLDALYRTMVTAADEALPSAADAILRQAIAQHFGTGASAAEHASGTACQGTQQPSSAVDEAAAPHEHPGQPVHAQTQLQTQLPIARQSSMLHADIRALLLQNRLAKV